MNGVHTNEVSSKKSISFKWPIVAKYANGPKICTQNNVQTEVKESIYGKSRLKFVDMSQSKNSFGGEKRISVKNRNKLNMNTSASFALSSTFPLCGLQWALSVYPRGIDDDGQFLSVHLVCQSHHSVCASYSISLKNHLNASDSYCWKDDDEWVWFSSVEEGDNEWGNDEFVFIDEVTEESGFILNNEVVFEVEVRVRREEGIAYNSSEGLETSAYELERAVEDPVEQDQLLQQAKQDISSVLKKLSKGRDVDLQKSQEDHIVRSRLHKQIPHKTNSRK